MKLGLFLFSICFFLSTAQATTTVSPTDIISELPSCSLTCFKNAFSSLPAALSSPRIVCGNITLQSSLSACIQGSCNYTEQTQIAAINYHLCEGVPVESQSWTVTIVGLVCAPLALSAIALRCYARFSTIRRLGSDDWIIVAAGILMIVLIILYIINCLKNGFGRHFWNINPLLAVPGFAVFYACEIIYIGVITLVKCSILIFYLRIFPRKWFRIADMIVLGMVIGIGIAASLAVAFQCYPISGAWNRTINPTCINLNLLAYATGGIFVTQDVVILILPIFPCLKLQMGMKKKLQVIFMFSIGTLACIVSIVRLKYLVTFAGSEHLTWDNAIPSIWSFIEISVVIICACLPAIRTLLSRWLPVTFGFSSPSSNNHDRQSPAESHPYSATNQNPRNIIRLEKVGPSYNKRTVTQEQKLLYAARPVKGGKGGWGWREEQGGGDEGVD